jgi:hypothetical protein
MSANWSATLLLEKKGSKTLAPEQRHPKMVVAFLQKD